MSVVNKMLKDLEQRGNTKVHEADYVPVESESAKSRRLIIGLILIIVVLAAFVYVLLPKTAESSLPQSSLQNNQLGQQNHVGQKNQPSQTKQTDSFEGGLVANQKSPANSLESEQVEKSQNNEVLQNQLALEELDQEIIASLDANANEKTDLIDSEPTIVKVATVTQTAQATQITRAQTKQEITQKPTESVQLSNNTPVVEKASAEPVFNVSSNRKSTSDNSLLEQRIQLSLKNGDTPAAIKDLNQLLQLEPRNVSARKRLASLSFAQGDAVRAAMLLHQGIKLSPEDSSMRLMQARLLFREKKHAQALALLNEHPPTVLADNELLSFRAALAEKQGDYTGSYNDYSVLLQRQPNNARWMLGLAISQDKRELHKEAVATYKQVKSSNQLSTQVVSFVDGRLAALVGS